MKTIEIKDLRIIIETEISTIEKQLFHKDAFAAGCFLHKSGKKAAGQKLCAGVLNSLGFDKRRAYFSQILETLEGNEELFSSQILAHREIDSLFRSNVVPTSE